MQVNDKVNTQRLHPARA